LVDTNRHTHSGKEGHRYKEFVFAAANPSSYDKHGGYPKREKQRPSLPEIPQQSANTCSFRVVLRAGNGVE
jgi:hypothetical protein